MYSPDHQYSVDEYWRMVATFPEHKYEYVDGDIRMMTGGSLAHAEIGANIVALLRNGLRDSECHVYSSDALVQLSESRYYCPDASVSCDPADWTRTKALESPTVIVEVLSPGTEKIDNAEKLKAYKHFPTIQEILLIDSRTCLIEHHHRVGSYKWEVTQYEDQHQVIQLDSIEVSLPVREIYFKVYLELDEAE